MVRPIDELIVGHDEVKLDAPPEMMWGMKYPFTRRDGGAEGLLVLVLTFPLSLWLLSTLPVSLPIFVFVALPVILSACAGYLVSRWVTKRARRRRSETEAREAHIRLVSRESETRRKLEEARASGAFDRWEKR